MNTAQSEQGHIRRAAIIWVAATVVGLLVFFVLAPQFESWGVVPPTASERVGEINQVLWLFTALSIPVFTLVIVFAGYSIFAFRERNRPTSDGPVMRGNQRLQVTWIGVSIVLVAFLFGYGLYFLNQVSAAPAGDVLQVHVTGEQWLWNYSYPQYKDISGTTLELEVNRPVVFTINSIDVQHSFWIPSFGIKQDAVPGETTHISVTPNKIGDFVVRCAELCGLYHAYMETPIHVVSAADFQTWVSQQPIPVTPSASAFSTGGPPEAALVGIVGRRPSAG
ncbi:MAG TPA: cytochrome c oxidase subunit II [Ktedonobacterales bacterium]|nr:cytochrome c oxidase subunit II [Ktedonobacterales bacterium]